MPVYLVAECKRVNPSLSRWGFARAPYREDAIVFDRFAQLPDLHSTQTSKSYPTPVVKSSASKPYHIAVELKVKSAESDGPGHGAINNATAQVLRGTSGLINSLFPSDRPPIPREVSAFLPVIFTTSEIWVTDADIAGADLASGDLETLSCTKQDWIWFNHNRSPRLRHDLKWTNAKDLADALQDEFTRSIAIVSADGVDSFFSKELDWLFNEDFFHE